MTEKQQKYRKKNKIFTAWLPIEVHEWFCNYLKVKSVGSSTGERFRQWLYAVQKQNPAVPKYRPKHALNNYIIIFGKEEISEVE